jgi:hypothetical protein
VLRPQVVWQPSHLDEAERTAELDRWKKRLANIGPEDPIEVGPY